MNLAVRTLAVFAIVATAVTGFAQTPNSKAVVKQKVIAAAKQKAILKSTPHPTAHIASKHMTKQPLHHAAQKSKTMVTKKHATAPVKAVVPSKAPAHTAAKGSKG